MLALCGSVFTFWDVTRIGDPHAHSMLSSRKPSRSLASALICWQLWSHECSCVPHRWVAASKKQWRSALRQLTAACFQIVCLNLGLQITGQRAYLFSIIEFLVPRPVSVHVQPSLRRSSFPGCTWRMHTTSKQQVRSGRSSLGRLRLARACG